MSELSTGHPSAHGVESLARPVHVVDAATTCEEVDALFRASEDVECLAVLGTAPGQELGLLTRTGFQQRMSGRLGYGRVLNAGRAVAALTDWEPLVVPATTTVADLAQQVLGRADAQRTTEVLLADPGRPPRRVQVADVFRALSAQLALKALTDPLTGLANREHFMQHLVHRCADPDPRWRPVVLYVDLDGFKAFNDGHGHGVGDRVLQAVADRLRGCSGLHDLHDLHNQHDQHDQHDQPGERAGNGCAGAPQDLVARLGGDEFALITHLPAGQALGTALRELGERVRACLSGTLCVAGLVLPARASIGIAVAAGTGTDPETLLREADLAMYRAKAAGGARVESVTGVGAALAVETFAPDRRELQRAVDEQQFRVHYQPIVEVTSGRLASVEALVRWQHPTRGLLAPGAFLEAAAAAGFAPDLDLHVLRTALADVRRWRRRLGRAAPAAVNVNVSVHGLLHPDLVPAVLSALDDARLEPAVLRVELPEAATLTHLEVARGALEALRAAGVRLTLDDMGAGASTLHHLTGLALDGVKIDRRFVAGMLQDERDGAVVRMLLELAHGTGLSVTAEGVETREQLRALQVQARGRPTHAQGYLISPPVPAQELALPWPEDLHGLLRDGQRGAQRPPAPAPLRP